MIFYCILKSDSRGFPVSLVLHSFCCLAVISFICKVFPIKLELLDEVLPFLSVVQETSSPDTF